MRSNSDEHGIIILFFDLMQAANRVAAFYLYPKRSDVLNVPVDDGIREPVFGKREF